MNTSICPKCKNAMERNPVQVGNLVKFIGNCVCGYSADVTADILKEYADRSFSEEKLKQFLATCPKPGLNETIRRNRSELKDIMKTNNDELMDEILKKYKDLNMIGVFRSMDQHTEIFIINPNNLDLSTLLNNK